MSEHVADRNAGARAVAPTLDVLFEPPARPRPPCRTTAIAATAELSTGTDKNENGTTGPDGDENVDENENGD